ncbi:MAG: fused MFS/spermidine synthase [Pseudomonadota bacterium]
MVHTTAPDPSRLTRAALLLFTTTVFLSAGLLFFIQPLFAKIALPVLGGSAAVWTTAVLFFQSVVLVGYLYAHLSTRHLSPRHQLFLHGAIWGLALLCLPPALPDGWHLNPNALITGQTLGLLTLSVGLPMALLSSSTPLLQNWYARSNGQAAEDPYFLYGASSLGSLIGLCAFVLIGEPLFGLSTMAQLFGAGFIALGVGLLMCGLCTFNTEQVAAREVSDRPAPPLSKLALWVILAFVPSSLMLAVTSKITTDVGAVPMIWVIPLALYLLSFMLVFRDRTPFKGLWFTQANQLTAVAGLCLFAGVAGDHLSTIAMGFLILCFFALAIWSHRVLYEARPPSAHLTTFYLTLAVGGALGGVFNSVLAPLLFTDLIEGTVTMSLALILLFRESLGLTLDRVLRGGAVGLAVGGTLTGFASALNADVLLLIGLMGAGIAVIGLCRPGVAVFTIAAGIAVALPAWLASPDARVFADRSFFGLHQVQDQDGLRLYHNGTKLHGAQRLADMAARRPVPTTYYHPATPMGQILRSDIGQDAGRIGVVGLGVGSLACYAARDQDWHFYELDAMVARVARDPDLFTYLSACTPRAPVHLGDARLLLAQQQNIGFDVLVIDAFSSEAVPIHLATFEAVELYLNRLNRGGFLVFHISNRYYEFGTTLARSAEALGARAWRQTQRVPASDDPGYRLSDVVLIAQDGTDISDVLASGLWTQLDGADGPVLTDDKANPLSILKPGALKQ